MSSSNAQSVADLEASEHIRQSHLRCRKAGLDAGQGLEIVAEDFDPDSRLLAAAQPVLRRLNHALTNLKVGGLLADRNGTVIERYFGESSMRQKADRLGAVLGASFNEERTGTNGIATPIETRAPILVRAKEHYLESLRGFTCYGVPILNPLTHRLEGALDLMVAEWAEPGVMAGLLRQAVDEISTRMIEDYDPEVVRSAAAFRGLNRRTTDGLILIGRDFIVHNPRAADLLTAEDSRKLREMASRLTHGTSESVRFSSGHEYNVTAAYLDVEEHVLLRISDENRQRTPIPRAVDGAKPSHVSSIDNVLKHTAITDSVLVIGASGTGRTRAAQLLANGVPSVVVSGATAAPSAVVDTIRTLAQSHDTTPQTVIVEHAELLRADTCQAIVDAYRQYPSTRLIVTALPSYKEQPGVAYLVSYCQTWIELPPLSQRQADFQLIVDQIIDDISRVKSEIRPRMTRPALDHLKSLPWPGNIAELHEVLSATLDRRTVGDIVIADLPRRYRRASSLRANLTPMDKAERDIILATLTANDGNKARTARHLGISRSKLYDRIKYFQISIP